MVDAEEMRDSSYQPHEAISPVVFSGSRELVPQEGTKRPSRRLDVLEGSEKGYGIVRQIVARDCPSKNVVHEEG
jgi:hypothetical protein